MEYGKITKFQTGVAVPIFALRTAASEGIGDFYDLLEFGAWAEDNGLDLIQILPINDTGEESSPYSARTAFALHPVYLRIAEIPGASLVAKEVEKLRTLHNADAKVDFVAVVRTKIELLRKIYFENIASIQKSRKVQKWLSQNPWLKPYAVYCMLKDRNQQASWQQWPAHQNPTPAQINELWEQNSIDVWFYCWLQYHCEQQLSTVVKKLHKQGIKLKGDIPILINEDSADLWSERKYFDLSNRAGAPPDMFSYTGQNWGFPTYKWDELQKDDYQWWRNRLVQAAKFYHSYRIDHVLGFFRIWTVPSTEVTGLLGKFNPAIPLTTEEFVQRGIPSRTVHYLTHPNYGWDWLYELFGADTAEIIARFFNEIEYGRFVLKPEFYNERAITQADAEQSVRDALLKVYWNRLFTPSSTPEQLWPFWYWYDAPVLKTLPEHEQKIAAELIAHHEAIQDDHWEKMGYTLLKVLVEETDMLVCAEDLGTIPPSVPVVLDQLEILSLRIERWARDWAQEGQPYYSANEYPRLSVATTSSHDTSTLPGWWQEADLDRKAYWKHVKGPQPVPQKIDKAAAQHILSNLMQGNSLLVIPSLQDWLALAPKYTAANPETDRINIPGTVGPHNWTWRMPVTIAELRKDQALRKDISALVQNRKRRKL